MKRLMAALLSLIILLSLPITVSGAVIGEVLSTDIGTLIDDLPISAYNINDYTYVVAEDLRSYGFDVSWNGDDRTLSISHDVHKGYQMVLDKERINIKKADILKRQHVFDVYSTDIKTYLDGQEIDAYNVDGQTLIQVDYLAQYGTFSYDDSKRMVDIRICKPSFDYGMKIAEDLVETELTVNPPRYAQKVKYFGKLEKGEPKGIGIITQDGQGQFQNTFVKEYAYWDRFGDFYPKKVGLSYTVTEGSESVDNEQQRMYSCSTSILGDTWLNLQINGQGENGDTMECKTREEVSYLVKESGYSDGTYKNERLVSRTGVYDPSYVYGFYIDKEIYYDNEGNEINYSDAQTPLFTEIMADKKFSQQSFVKTADGSIYMSGHNGSGDAEGVDQPNTSAEVKTFVKTTNADFPIVNVNSRINNAIYRYSADGDGAYNRIISLTDNGDVYYERQLGTWAEVCKDQSDGIDLSSPTKIFEGAKWIGLQLEDVGVVTGYATIPYFYVVDSNDNLWSWNYEYYRQPQTGNEYDENNGYIAYGRVPYIKEPVMIMENVKEVFGTTTKYVLKIDGTLWRINEEENTQILDNVKDMDADKVGMNFMALKNDGTLWVWGKNQNGQCGVGNTKPVWNPTQIKNVYNYIEPQW